MTLTLILHLLLLYSPTDAGKTSSYSRTPLRVVGISDGDTYEALLPDKKTIKIRMEGIDAPEKGMPFYRVAKDYLSELCFGRNVEIKKISTDRYGRTIARTYLPGQQKELGLMMIEAGYAWHFKKYSSDPVLAKAEIEAQKSKRGLWADPNPVAPWDYRKQKKAAHQH